MNNEVNYYIALVGKNPLPIFISGLKFIDLNTKVYLLYTVEDNSISSKKVAENIKASLDKKKNVENEIKLVPCDKSDFAKITKSLDEIYSAIKSDDSKVDDMNVYVDYTGGTKMMSSITYNYFKEKSNALNNINFFGAYVSSSAEKVYKMKFENYEKLSSQKYCFKNIADGSMLNKDDIINLHGYNLKNKGEKIFVINNESNSEIDCEIKDISLDKFTLRNTFLVNIELDKKGNERVGSLVSEYFKCKDLSEKLGGSECIINLLVERNVSDKFIEDFYDRIRNITNEKDNSNIENKVKIIKS